MANPQSLVVEEEEGAIANEGSTEGKAELILFVRGDAPGGIIEEVLGVEFFVTQKLVGAAMKLVGTGPDSRVDDGAVAASKFRTVGIRLDLEFLQRFY